MKSMFHTYTNGNGKCVKPDQKEEKSRRTPIILHHTEKETFWEFENSHNLKRFHVHVISVRIC